MNPAAEIQGRQYSCVWSRNTTLRRQATANDAQKGITPHPDAAMPTHR